MPFDPDELALDPVRRAALLEQLRTDVQRRRVRRRARTSLAVAGAGVATPAAAAPAGSEVPGGFETWDELLAMQQRLVAAADAVTATIGERDTGLAAISAMPERRELWIYWKGEVPGDVAEAIDAQRGSVPVRVLPARYSKTELLAAAEMNVQETSYVGDGTLDVPVMRMVGLAITVVDAHLDALSAAHFVTKLSGGQGAVREVTDLLLASKNV